MKMKYLTETKQLLSDVNIETFKEHLRFFGIPIRKPFRLEYLLILPIHELLDYQTDINPEDDLLLACHRGMIKLQEQLKRNRIEVLQFSLETDFDEKLWIRCQYLEFGFIRGYQSYLDELMNFSNQLDQLNIPGMLLEAHIPIAEGEEGINLWGSYNIEDYELELKRNHFLHKI